MSRPSASRNSTAAASVRDVLVLETSGEPGIDAADHHGGKPEEQDRVEHHQTEPDRAGPPGSASAARTARVSSAISFDTRVDQAVPGSDHGLDRLGLVVLGQFATQRAHSDPHRVGERIGVLIPDVLEQVFLGQDLVDVSHKVAQQRKLLGREIKFTSAALGPLRCIVEFDVTDRETAVVPAASRRMSDRTRAVSSPNANGLIR